MPSPFREAAGLERVTRVLRCVPKGVSLLLALWPHKHHTAVSVGHRGHSLESRRTAKLHRV